MREIRGLRWARALEARPRCIPQSRPRGKKREGIRYEEALSASAPWLIRGQWFEFEDRVGRGYCQIDFISQPLGMILEAKYTWTEEGHRQIEGLYRPVLEEVLKRTVIGIVVCKKLIVRMSSVKVSGDFHEAHYNARGGARSVLHWIGVGPLMTSRESEHQLPLAPARSAA